MKWKDLPPKEKGLIKGGLRRVFSRSELRRRVIEKGLVENEDPKRTRVSKWVWCESCGEVFPKYLAVVDHILPIIPLDRHSETVAPTELVEALWCDESNLQRICKPCHLTKSRAESKIRRDNRKKAKQ